MECFAFLEKFCLKNFSFQEEFSELQSNLHTSLCKAPFILVTFERNFEFLDTYSKITQENLGSRTPLITNKSVHEHIFRTKNVSVNERCLE
jgi:hypothetical protein